MIFIFRIAIYNRITNLQENPDINITFKDIFRYS